MSETPSPGSPRHGKFAAILASKTLTVLLLYVGVGLGHHLYLEARFQWDRIIAFDPREAAAENLLRRQRHPDVENTLVDLSVSGKSCTGVPLRGTEILLTAGHCLVDDDVNVVSTGTLRFSWREGDQWREASPDKVELFVHPRYLVTAAAEPLTGPERMILSAFTWATIRGADRDDSPYTWDMAVVRTPGTRWTFGVDGITTSDHGPYHVEAYQNFTLDGTPVCTLELPENCPAGTVASETVEQERRGVRCTTETVRRPARVDGWFPCALMPGGSGGALLVERSGRVLLRGLVTGGDPWAEGNGVTSVRLVGFVEPFLADDSADRPSAG
jgi:hypothetical protein